MSLNEGVLSGAFDDLHCHVGFMTDPDQFEKNATAQGSNILAVSVTPEDYQHLLLKLKRSSESPVGYDAERLCEASAEKLDGNSLGGFTEGLSCTVLDNSDSSCVGSTLHVALGLHPWWVPDDDESLAKVLAEFDAYFPAANYIGEVGLDFSQRHRVTKEYQEKAFKHIVNRCSRRGGSLLSLHCVQAYPEMLSLLEESGVVHTCTCIFHWFSGSSQQLTWAIRQGCFFSISKRMLASKRGREYAKAIPEDRLLLETDAPSVAIQSNEIPTVSYTFAQVQAELQEALQLLANARGQDPSHLAGVIKKNVKQLFNLKEFMH